MSEQDLVAIAQSGSGDAFEQLVRLHRGAVVRFALRLTKSRDDAEDVAQETFLRAYRKLHTYVPTAPLARWLYRIAQNVALDETRRRKREDARAARLELGVEAGPEERAVRSDEADRLWSALDMLSPRAATAVRLHYRGGLTYEEISRALGVPLGTVKTDVWRARHTLRDRLPAHARPAAA